MGQAPGWSAAVYVAFLCQRHETRANDRLTPADATMATFGAELSARTPWRQAARPLIGSQFGVSTGSDYGHFPTCIQVERHPHPVDFVVDDA